METMVVLVRELRFNYRRAIHMRTCVFAHCDVCTAAYHLPSLFHVSLRFQQLASDLYGKMLAPVAIAVGQKRR
jgi:hypothetical protein